MDIYLYRLMLIVCADQVYTCWKNLDMHAAISFSACGHKYLLSSILDWVGCGVCAPPQLGIFTSVLMRCD